MDLSAGPAPKAGMGFGLGPIWAWARGQYGLWDLGAVQGSYDIKGLFGLSLFLLKLKTETENTVAKYFLNV